MRVRLGAIARPWLWNQTKQQAPEAVDPFVRDWEFDTGIRHGLGYFELEFDKAEIIDRKQTTGVIEAHLEPARFHVEVSIVAVTVAPTTYPSPPSDIDSSNPNVQTPYERYRRYREGRENLPSFAYFCLTVLEYPFGMHSRRRKAAGGQRQAAAALHDIGVDVLQRIGELSSTKGGRGGRKRKGA